MGAIRYSTYMVDFNRKHDADHSMMDYAVSSITVRVFAKDILEALQKAWDAVRITPQDYEVEQITREGRSWSR